MIADARLLQPEFVPGDVRHRDGEVNALTSGLQPIAAGRKTEPVLLYGPSGMGKTCIVRHTVDRLRKEVFDLDTQYVNCWEDYTRFKTLYRASRGSVGHSASTGSQRRATSWLTASVTPSTTRTSSSSTGSTSWRRRRCFTTSTGRAGSRWC